MAEQRYRRYGLFGRVRSRMHVSRSKEQLAAIFAHLRERGQPIVGAAQAGAQDILSTPHRVRGFFKRGKESLLTKIANADPGDIAGHAAAITAIAAESLLKSALDYQVEKAEETLAHAATRAENRLRRQLSRRISAGQMYVTGAARVPTPLADLPARKRLRSAFEREKAMHELHAAAKKLGLDLKDASLQSNAIREVVHKQREVQGYKDYMQSLEREMRRQNRHRY